MRTLLGTIVVVSASVVIGLLLWGGPERLDAAPKPKLAPIVVSEPATVQVGETVRVSVFNDDPQITVAYVIQLADVLTGAIVDEQTVGPVQPLTGVVVDYGPHNARVERIVVMRASTLTSMSHPVGLSSVQVVNSATGVVRHVPSFAGEHTSVDFQN